MENSWYRSAPDVLKVEDGWRCISYAKLVWSFFMDYVFCVLILWRVHSSQTIVFTDVFLKRPVAAMPLGDRSGSNKLQQVVELFLGRFAGFSHGKRSERGCHVPIGNVAKDDGTWICVISWMNILKGWQLMNRVFVVCVCVQWLPKIHISVDNFKISMLSKILRFEFASKMPSLLGFLWLEWMPNPCF